MRLIKMVTKIEDKFQCNECKLIYAKKDLAEKCEAWCKEHKSCNLEIIKFAVK
jgi:hypothetical protein